MIDVQKEVGEENTNMIVRWESYGERCSERDWGRMRREREKIYCVNVDKVLN